MRWSANKDTQMKCDQMRFIFNIVSLVVHTLLRYALQSSDIIGQKIYGL